MSTQQVQDQLVNAASSVPFLTVLGVNFATFNEAAEAATLILGFVTGTIAFAFQVRRWFRGRKRDKAIKDLMDKTPPM